MGFLSACFTSGSWKHTPWPCRRAHPSLCTDSQARATAISICCFEPPSVWYFVTAAQETNSPPPSPALRWGHSSRPFPNEGGMPQHSYRSLQKIPLHHHLYLTSRRGWRWAMLPELIWDQSPSSPTGAVPTPPHNVGALGTRVLFLALGPLMKPKLKKTPCNIPLHIIFNAARLIS